MNSPQQNTIFIGNLPFSTTKMDLQALFETFGTITNIHIPVNKETGQARGFAFVSFESGNEAEAALSVNGQDVKGRAIKVHLAHNNSQNGSAPRSGDRGPRRSFGSGNRFEGRGGFNRNRQ
ncbi:RNA-binding protein [Candidatus Dependentiae bacterium]|nr:RNA-binding protein [Candidatus Dependentiae bacterium]